MINVTTAASPRSTTASWDRQVGAHWAAILKASELDRFATVVEVGPGFSSKVAHGLRERGFRGSLFVVEPNSEARAWIRPRYERLLPGAAIVTVGHPISSAAAHLPSRVEALLMNHLLDDLILNEALEPRQRGPVFGKMRRGAPCAHAVRSVWHRLCARPATFASLSRRVLDELSGFCDALAPRLFGLSQYPSWAQERAGLELVDRLTAPLLRQLAGRLEDAERSVELLALGGREPRWLVARAPAQRKTKVRALAS